jgi:hypothetical protein
VIREAEETETMQENIQEWIWLGEGFRQEEIAAVTFVVYFH